MFARAGAEVRERNFLTQKQPEEPVLVAAWLKKNAATADKERAAQAHAFGAAKAKRGGLSGVVKGFGESAIRLPSAHALITSADALARSIGALRQHRKDHAEFQARDLRSIELLYRPALASDDVMQALSPQERQQTSANAACVAVNLRDGSGLNGCAPPRAYGVRRY